VSEPDRMFFPWASVIRFGLGHLRLSPEVFWRLSLVELVALIGGSGRTAMADRQQLDALMALFPDTKREKDPDDDR